MHPTTDTTGPQVVMTEVPVLDVLPLWLPEDVRAPGSAHTNSHARSQPLYIHDKV